MAIGKLVRLSFVYLGGVSLSACTCETVERDYVWHAVAANGMPLVVEKSDRITQRRGMLTNTDYGSTHTFTYKLHMDTDYLTWYGGDSEPKSLLFCGEQILLRSLRKRYVPMIISDAGAPSSATTTSVEKPTTVVAEEVERFVDERYFWRMFGETTWVREDPSVYHQNKPACLETMVPNDNELSSSQP